MKKNPRVLVGMLFGFGKMLLGYLRGFGTQFVPEIFFLECALEEECVHSATDLRVSAWGRVS